MLCLYSSHLDQQTFGFLRLRVKDRLQFGEFILKLCNLLIRIFKFANTNGKALAEPCKLISLLLQAVAGV